MLQKNGRVTRKNAIAEILWNSVAGTGLEGTSFHRRFLANNPQESSVLALMTFISKSPHKGDAPLILEASKLPVSNPTDYKSLEAIEALRVNDTNHPKFLDLVEHGNLHNALKNILKRLPEAKARIDRLNRPLWEKYSAEVA